jgi:Kef-type K+ transport system membrane component KefB
LSVTTSSVSTLVLIALAAVLAPILSELSGPVAIPEIVIQIGFGILMGPYVLHLTHPSTIVTGLSDLGLTYLIFLAGFELDLRKIRGSPLRLACIGWGISLVIGLSAAFALVFTGLALDTLVIGLALTTTALGTLVPMLRDAGLFDTRFGSYIGAIGTVGEFGPIVAVALLLTKKEPVLTSLLLAAFIVVAVITVMLAARSQPPRVVAMLNRHLESSAQLPVRVSLLLIVLLVLLAQSLGLDVLLGAFAAGIVVRLFSASGESERIRAKLEAIGFGFLIPIFFVVSGTQFNLQVFIGHPESLWRVPLFVALMLAARGVPVLLLYRNVLPRPQRLPMVLLSATGLPLIVVVTSIATAEGRILPVNAAALVAAGMVTVLLFPATGFWRMRKLGTIAEPQGSPA